VALIILFSIIGCQPNQSTELSAFTISGPTMGTRYNITVVDSENDNLSKSLQKEVDVLLINLNQQMSTYISDSEISQFNSKAINQSFSISEDFLKVVALSQEISALSEGFFDISIGPLVELWGFGKTEKSGVPSDSEIENARSQVGWQELTVDFENISLTKSIQLSLDVSAIAKGYGVDRVAALLDEKGIENYMVEIGGEMKVKGHNSQETSWRIGIETPTVGQRQVQQIIKIDSHAVATSGDYRNFFEENGQRFSHTIDPNTGYPVRHNIASVTVIAESAARADGLATALNVLGEEKALELARKENLSAFFIFYQNENDVEQYRIEYTPQFKQYLIQ
jgi:thiamine biosynthesis lipoprotein